MLGVSAPVSVLKKPVRTQIVTVGAFRGRRNRNRGIPENLWFEYSLWSNQWDSYVIQHESLCKKLARQYLTLLFHF